MKIHFRPPLPASAAYAATLTIILVGDAVHALAGRRKRSAAPRFTLRLQPDPDHRNRDPVEPQNQP